MEFRKEPEIEEPDKIAGRWVELGERAILHPARRHNCLAWTDGDYLVAGVSENVIVLRPEAMLSASNYEGLLEDRAILDADLGRRLRLKESVRGLEVVASVGSKAGLSGMDWRSVHGCGGWIVTVGGRKRGEVCGWMQKVGEKWGGVERNWTKEWTLGRDIDPLAGDCVKVGEDVLIAVGGRKGLGIWRVQQNKLQKRISERLVKIIDGRWASSVSWLHNSETESLYLATGRLDATVEIYEVKQKDDGSEEGESSSKLVWGDSRGLPLPVSILSWNVLDDKVILASGAGNSVTCYCFPRTHEVAPFSDFKRISLPPAHQRLISAIVFNLNHQLIIASQDGAVTVWQIPDESSSLEYVANLRERNLSRPVFGLTMSPNRLLMALMTSILEPSGPMTASTGEGSTLNKFVSSQRKCLISIWASCGPQVTYESLLENIIGQFKGSCLTIPLNIWDFEQAISFLYSRQESQLVEILECAKRLAGGKPVNALNNKLAFRLLRLRAKLLEDHANHQHADDVHVMLQQCHNNSLKIHAYRSLHNFIRRYELLSDHTNIQACSILEVLTAQSMLQYIQDEREMKSLLPLSELKPWLLSTIRESLGTLGTQKRTSFSYCPICGPEEGALAKESKCGRAWFVCENGHGFPLCVLTTLPVLDAVPLNCQGCGACASIAEQGNKDFEWIEHRERCSLCNMPFSWFSPALHDQ